jgi:hypothetical protein
VVLDLHRVGHKPVGADGLDAGMPNLKSVVPEFERISWHRRKGNEFFGEFGSQYKQNKQHEQGKMAFFDKSVWQKTT